MAAHAWHVLGEHLDDRIVPIGVFPGHVPMVWDVYRASDSCDTVCQQRFMSTRSWWGWGDEASALGDDDAGAVAQLAASRLGFGTCDPLPAPVLEAFSLPAPRVAPPARLAPLFSDDHRERALHAHGQSFREVARLLLGDLPRSPDLVALPRSRDDVAAVLEWASSSKVAVLPYGGGTSVVGGVTPEVGDGYAGVVSLDLQRMDRVLDIDTVSRAAWIQAGALGPAMEMQLRPHGFTLRHQPQSFEFSTLGGWLATRSGGHFATLRTRIDDVTEALHVVTPAGHVDVRRLPSSGAGPDPNRLFLGSEGTLGVITDAWMRVVPRPLFRASAVARFDGFGGALTACRALAQSGLHPAGCRVLDPAEALTGGAGDGSEALLLLAFESHDHPVDSLLARGVELASDHGGRVTTRAQRSGDEAAEAWRSTFIRAPYLRDALARFGFIVETFESAVTWDRLQQLLDAVDSAACAALDAAGAVGMLSCRITHAYPDGAAPYWTLIARGAPGAQVEQWDALKAAVSDALIRCGGTITHHHAVGRDHVRWYAQETDALYMKALSAVKMRLDPQGILNPGVLLGG
jgi:alkyldihydroxyacetonephosphate synthase